MGIRKKENTTQHSHWI